MDATHAVSLAVRPHLGDRRHRPQHRRRLRARLTVPLSAPAGASFIRRLVVAHYGLRDWLAQRSRVLLMALSRRLVAGAVTAGQLAITAGSRSSRRSG
jgi:hypothetical protein